MAWSGVVAEFGGSRELDPGAVGIAESLPSFTDLRMDPGNEITVPVARLLEGGARLLSDSSSLPWARANSARWAPR